MLEMTGQGVQEKNNIFQLSVTTECWILHYNTQETQQRYNIILDTLDIVLLNVTCGILQRQAARQVPYTEIKFNIPYNNDCIHKL